MKFLFFTGSRGEWGYIRPILELIKKNPKHSYNICVTNMHVLDNFGFSQNEIVKDGFKISDSIYMTLDGYNHATTSKSMGILMQSFTDILDRLKPDWLVLAGDRHETLIASIVSSYMYVPIAHIQAGELSGNIDGLARHAIGKFSHLHFSSNSDATKRLIKLGEEKFRIKQVGAPQLDDIKKGNVYSKNEICKLLKLESYEKYVLVIFHPVTEEYHKLGQQIKVLIDCLNNLNEKKIWILPNSDSGSSIIRDIIYKNITSNILLFENFERKKFLGLIENCQFLIGNSSSGILEAPSFKIPVINLGRRQYGRLRAKNIIDVPKISKKNIMKAIKNLNSINFKDKLKRCSNPYGDGNSSKKIINFLENTKINEKLLIKKLTY